MASRFASFAVAAIPLPQTPSVIRTEALTPFLHFLKHTCSIMGVLPRSKDTQPPLHPQSLQPFRHFLGNILASGNPFLPVETMFAGSLSVPGSRGGDMPLSQVTERLKLGSHHAGNHRAVH